MSKSIRVHSLPWRLGPSTWRELQVNGAFPRLHKQLDSTKPHASALLKVYSHPGTLQAPHFQGGTEVALEAADSLGSGSPSPDPEAPCAQRTAVGL